MESKVSLKPTWLVNELVPVFSESATRQVILSNGDIGVIVGYLIVGA